MQNSTYEEYMRNVLGYQPVMPSNTYQRNKQYYETTNRITQEVDIENMYPDIYQVVFPMVQKAYNTNTREISEDLIEELTQNILDNVPMSDLTENREEGSEKREDRQRRPNRLLRDLIKILLLRQFLGYPVRPPYPQYPPRPPYPGGPGPVRPPFGPNRGTSYPTEEFAYNEFLY